ncbi:MAG TPA: carbohydrate ABC transporter permease, partial [Aggregatilineales bacterium]|nr:carbohydrate ABC transporter permease [Aggregatilineales bacterium]
MELLDQATVKETVYIPQQAPRSYGDLIWRTLNLVLLLFFAFLMLMPFVWLVTSSLKTQLNIFQYPPSFLPDPVQFQNYVDALTLKPFHLYLRNTLIIAILNVIAVVVSSSLCAYGFARMRFPGRNFWFGVVMATLFLPYAILIVPHFLMFSKLNWVDTFLPLTVPQFFGGGAFNIFLMRQFFRTIPEDLSDAARLDGCTEFGIYWRIMLPLSKPALITVGIFT